MLLSQSGFQSYPGRLLLGAACFISILWILAAWKAHGHYQAGRAHQAAGRMLEAAREYQSALGFYAPLNPWSRAGAAALLGMARDMRHKDPALAFELEDRLRRSVHGIRWMIQPYRDILAGIEQVQVQPFRDPSAWLFFLSLGGLISGCGALFIPKRGLMFRAAVLAGGLAVWALALRYC